MIKFEETTGRMRRLGVNLDCEAVWVEDEVEWGLSDLVKSNIKS